MKVHVIASVEKRKDVILKELSADRKKRKPNCFRKKYRVKTGPFFK